MDNHGSITLPENAYHSCLEIPTPFGCIVSLMGGVAGDEASDDGEVAIER